MNEKLSDIEYVRKRPGMYIGDTTSRGLHHLPGEIIGNSIDEFLRGRATRVAVSVQDGIVTVADDGSGLPFDEPSTLGGASLANDYLSSFHRTPSADNHGPHVHFHSALGVGMFVVNALSEFFKVESWRNGKLYRQAFVRGVPTSDLEVSEGLSAEAFLENSNQPKRGTRVTYKADPEIFGEQLTDALCIRSQLFDAAHLHPGIVIELQNERFCAPGGLGDFVRFSSFSTVTDCFSFNEVHDEVAIHAAASTGTISVMGSVRSADDSTRWVTWANGVRTIFANTSGTHEDAFAEALESVGWQPRIAMIHVVMREPMYAGPTKAQLDVPDKKQSMIDALQPALESYCRAQGLGRFKETGQEM